MDGWMKQLVSLHSIKQYVNAEQNIQTIQHHSIPMFLALHCIFTKKILRISSFITSKSHISCLFSIQVEPYSTIGDIKSLFHKSCKCELVRLFFISSYIGVNHANIFNIFYCPFTAKPNLCLRDPCSR